MHLNWFGVACAAASVALCFLLHPLLLKWPEPRRRIFAIAATLLALPGASFAIVLPWMRDIIPPVFLVMRLRFKYDEWHGLVVEVLYSFDWGFFRFAAGH